MKKHVKLKSGFMSNTLSPRVARLGFTLPEVLITLVIVGVVAAMTIPNLVQRAREKATVAKVKETYSMLTQAYNYVLGEYGTPEGWGDTSTEINIDSAQQHTDFTNKLKTYLKLSADCVGQSSSYTQQNCNKISYAPSIAAHMRLINGVDISVRVWNKNCSSIYATGKRDTCGLITAYLEPFNANSKSGQQIFHFYLTTEGIIPYGKQNSLLNFENLHCDDLSWTGKKTCR